MERSADSGVPPSQGRCPARVHFHIALAGICVPLVGLVTAIILALKDRARNGQDGEHRRWTRRLFGLIIVDLLVFASLVVFGMHQEETVQALSNPVARLESGPRIGVTFDPASQDPRVLTVVPDMPAARAGLRPGDRITSIDGVDTRTYPEVQETILRGTAGVMRRIGVSRGDERLDVVVVPVIPRELRLMDTVAEKRAIPWHHGLVWVLCACVMAGIARIIAKRRGAPRIVIWRVIIDSPVRSNRQDAEDAKKTDSEKISKALLGTLGDLAVITEGSGLLVPVNAGDIHQRPRGTTEEEDREAGVRERPLSTPWFPGSIRVLLVQKKLGAFGIPLMAPEDLRAIKQADPLHRVEVIVVPRFLPRVFGYEEVPDHPADALHHLRIPQPGLSLP